MLKHPTPPNTNYSPCGILKYIRPKKYAYTVYPFRVGVLMLGEWICLARSFLSLGFLGSRVYKGLGVSGGFRD